MAAHLENMKAAEFGENAEDLRQDIAGKLVRTVGKVPEKAQPRDWYRAIGFAIRDRLTERMLESEMAYDEQDAKRVYYLSVEYLTGRTLSNAVLNLGLDNPAHLVLNDIGLSLEDLAQLEEDAGLGNGGLGRLAACYLDSMATLGLPGYGYGIRYDYGIFKQSFGPDGQQIEKANRWLHYEYVWERRRPGLIHTIRFKGRDQSAHDKTGQKRHAWIDTEDMYALAYDTPVPGHDGKTVNYLRLWAGRAKDPFVLESFNSGDYPAAVSGQIAAKNLSRILYPDDTTPQGKELRLRQQYFFVSASLQDIVARYLERHEGFDEFPDKVAIQLNDTHPALAIPELMRLLIDEHGLTWDAAWSITRRTFAYTNHTLLPEALESWPVRMIGYLLPRHLSLIYEINDWHLKLVRKRYPNDPARVARMSLIHEDGEPRVRMSSLAIVGSHKVNGVAKLHSRLMTETIFADFHALEPDKFTNVTNGITPRRWLKLANPQLSQVISDRIGEGWVTDLEKLKGLVEHSEDPEFVRLFADVKRENKKRLARVIQETLDVTVSPDALFDVQVKRIHEYKRQLMNILYVIWRYRQICDKPGRITIPRVVVFGGKAAPGYVVAKQIIQLINCVASVVNNDPRVGDLLKVAYLPNYNVSLAQKIIPAADLSEQISTAGMEASGTGNMKLSLNGALTIGTLDGANIEIKDAVGDDNIFVFGLGADEAIALRKAGYDPGSVLDAEPELAAVLELVRSGVFSPSEPDRFAPLMDRISTPGEHFLVLADFAAFRDAQARVDAGFGDSADWYRRAIINTASVGHFSSDRSVGEYARNIWGVEPRRD